MFLHHCFRRSLTIAGTAAVAGCVDTTPVAPSSERAPQVVTTPQLAASVEFNTTIAELRRVTARYHNIAAAEADGFVRITPACEEREGEVPVAIVYGHFGRVLDGALDPSLPDGLLYEPGDNDKMKLVGVEMVMPYPLWASAEPPRFLGVPLQREDEFGVFGLHIWIWRHSPNGLFSVENPRVSCEAAP